MEIEPPQWLVTHTQVAPKHQTKMLTKNKQTVKKMKKRIWTRQKTGLFGWKTTTVSIISVYAKQSISDVFKEISNGSTQSSISAD